MKIYEIVAEKYYPIEEERLDEVVPLIAGLSVGGVLTAISVVMAAMSFADLIKFIGKYNEDPSKISEEEWNDLFIDVMLLAIPGVAKLGRPVVVKLMRKNRFTRAALTKGGKWLNAKVSDLWTKKKPAKFNQDYRQRLKQAKIDYPKSELAKNLARAKFKGAERLKEIGNVYNWVVNIGGSAYYIQDYYTNVGVLEKEWEDWVDSTKNNTPLKMPNRFADMSYSDAEAKFDSERNLLLGKATIGIVTATGFAPAFFKFASGKAASLGIAAMKTGTTTGVVGGAAAAASMGVLNAGARLMGLVAGKGPGGMAGRTAIITWLETTKEGRDFQQAWAVQALFKWTGWFTDKVLAALNLAYEGLRKIAKKFGIDLPEAPASVKPGGGSGKPDKELKDKEEKEQAARDAKRIKINGIPVTDSEGYLTTDPMVLRHGRVQIAINDAKLKGQPNPLDGIPRHPTKPYSSEVQGLAKGMPL